MEPNNEPGLLRDLKCVLLMEFDRRALKRALKFKEGWLGPFLEDVGEEVVRDVIEDLCLKLRICKTKLEVEEKTHAETRFEKDILQGLIDKNNGDVEDYEYGGPTGIVVHEEEPDYNTGGGDPFCPKCMAFEDDLEPMGGGGGSYGVFQLFHCTKCGSRIRHQC